MLRVCVFFWITAAALAQPPQDDAEVKISRPAPSGPALSRDDTHIMGVVPNYGTVNHPGHIDPISTKEKFWLATQDAFDPFSWAISGVYAASSQWGNQYPEFGQGASGYAKRYGGAFADQAIGDYMTEAILPSVLHQDPRYFRMGPTAGKWKRSFYAMSRVIITRTDSGHLQFNYSEIAGNGIAAGLSAIYYPPSSRNVDDVLEKFALNVVSDAGFNVLKEFWPDMKHKLFGK